MRLYAEDPAHGFRPAAGPVRRFSAPPGAVATTVCVAWPDTEEDTVMVDHPDGGALPWPWRLTDVPVVDG